ncbi:MAG TPA: 8-amino-7-oxononanoate synthase [Polyangia bacterium]|nr:8-amino-7-oxononanoate synthase [Polyangia bacterium]
MRDFAEQLQAELDALARADRLRACPEVAGPSRRHIRIADRPFVSFCSNDYLGLADHPALIAAAARAAKGEGVGAGAARLVSGDLPSHRALEADLAHFLGREAALLFPTGYQTNVGTVSALAGPEDLVVSDALNHASLIDGCRLSRATVAVYDHANPASARAALARAGTFRRRLLVTESLFSMDGDCPPLADLAAIASESDAVLIVDEAHAIGATGPGGRGMCAAAGISPDVLIGTLGKAFGAAGGFVAGPAALRSLLLNRARTFVFTTASPPPIAAAGRAALAIISGADGDDRRQRLAANRARLFARLPGICADQPPGPIVPVIVGADADALKVAAELRARGLFVPAIRPPTVPTGTARVRVTLSSEHTTDEIDLLAAALQELLP